MEFIRTLLIYAIQATRNKYKIKFTTVLNTVIVLAISTYYIETA